MTWRGKRKSLYWLLVGVLLLAPHRRAEAQVGPDLMGYRVGDTWSLIGRAMPCRIDSLPAKWTVKVKDCWPSGGIVRLTFVKDTLFLISYIPGADDTLPPTADETLPAEVLWNRRWKQWSIAHFGAPDSVNTSSAGKATGQVIAYWHKASRFAQVGVSSVPGQAWFVKIDACGEIVAGVRCVSSWLGLYGQAK